MAGQDSSSHRLGPTEEELIKPLPTDHIGQWSVRPIRDHRLAGGSEDCLLDYILDHLPEVQAQGEDLGRETPPARLLSGEMRLLQDQDRDPRLRQAMSGCRASGTATRDDDIDIHPRPHRPVRPNREKTSNNSSILRSRSRSSPEVKASATQLSMC